MGIYKALYACCLRYFNLQWLVFRYLNIDWFSRKSLNLGQHRYGGEWLGCRVGWVVAKAETKKEDDTNGKIQSGYDFHMYSQ